MNSNARPSGKLGLDHPIIVPMLHLQLFMASAMLALAKSQNVGLGIPKVTPPFYTPLQMSYGSLAGTRTDWDLVV